MTLAGIQNIVVPFFHDFRKNKLLRRAVVMPIQQYSKIRIMIITVIRVDNSPLSCFPSGIISPKPSKSLIPLPLLLQGGWVCYLIGRDSHCFLFKWQWLPKRQPWPYIAFGPSHRSLGKGYQWHSSSHGTELVASRNYGLSVWVSIVHLLSILN